jgi:hypothetical protein
MDQHVRIHIVSRFAIKVETAAVPILGRRLQRRRIRTRICRAGLCRYW